MKNCPSRTEERETTLLKAAKEGNLSTEYILYPAEMTKLEKQGFRVYNIKPFGNIAGLYQTTNDWSLAFGLAIPHIIQSYIIGFIEGHPKKHINNFAKKL